MNPQTFDNLYIDQLIDFRRESKITKNYELLDAIRDYLDTHLVFVFDLPGGRDEVYYLTEKFFARKPNDQTNRQFVEAYIQNESKAERLFLGWLASVRASMVPRRKGK